MIKVELKMNTDLIVDRGVYVPEAILGGIDDAFQQFGFRKEVYDDGTICFWGNRKRERIKKNTPVNHPGLGDGDYFVVRE